ncbi:MAG: surface-adhesin E family protein [[Pasteurella] aerogenes]|nr:surface-adhesin E family protein [[Pasteurella] aerogenes]
MKKCSLAVAIVLLSACSTVPQPTQTEVSLVPPTKVQPGYYKLVKDAEYFIDTASVWEDNEDKHLIHFDVVINSNKGLFVYKDNPELYAKSLREYKIMNCKTFHLTQVRTDFYSEFWGQGLRAAPKFQIRHTIALQKNSTLYTLGQVMCANLYRSSKLEQG